MFSAVRTWWSNDKGRHLSGLFAFEFLVVVLGVLTAQAVADWSRDRAAERDMLATKAGADAQIAAIAASSIAYARVIPCMDRRMIVVMRAASGEGQLEPAMLVRPIVRADPFTQLSDESLLQIRRRYGRAVAERYVRLESNVQRLHYLVSSLADGWQALSILSPETGRVSSGDRQEARIIASRMRSTLRSLAQMNINIANHARQLGITPKLDPGQRLPGGCTDLWRWNEVIYDPEDDPARP